MQGRSFVISALFAAAFLATTMPASPLRAESRLPLALAEQGAQAPAAGIRTDHPEAVVKHRPSREQSFSVGVTPYWETELGGEWYRDEAEPDAVHFGAVRWRNTFYAAPLWLIPALQIGTNVEYGIGWSGGEIGALLFGGGVNTALAGGTHGIEVSLWRELGDYATSTWVSYTAQSRWSLAPSVTIGIDASGEPGALDYFPALLEQTHRVGPALSGQIDNGPLGTLAYEVGYQVGLTPADPTTSLNWYVSYQLGF